MVFKNRMNEEVRIQRLGDRLRWSNGEITLIRTAKDKGFKLVKGEVVEISVEEQSKLEREFLLNPWLWRGPDLRKRIAKSTLEGGLLALGYPAHRFRVPGPSEFEMFFYENGSPAGYRYRDQLRKQLIDVLVHGQDVWLVIDHKKLEKGWKMTTLDYTRPDSKLFERPAQ